MALRGFEHLNLPAARHPRRFYRVQHSNSYTSQDEVTGEFHAEGRLTQGSARCLPHFLKRINLSTPWPTPDPSSAGAAATSSFWASSENEGRREESGSLVAQDGSHRGESSADEAETESDDEDDYYDGHALGYPNYTIYLYLLVMND
ncbi:hypothetical protein NKR19_g473 [Coniochaeta hoffmannii]|uniref:Uncharacterized protein n=1 Tax=Coniochaeta hoffmannii TaxID=91930 RepID=A0AA38SM38_9PEZI|nr:hypothetical protein NKR19_g473 [Coniochaeta hoffmannii]